MLSADVVLLLESCPLAALILDAADMIVFANRQACELFEKDEILSGMPISVLLPGWSAKEGAKARLVVERPSGQSRSCEISATAFPVSGEQLTAVWIDAAERNSAFGIAAREANLRLRYVIEMLPQAVCVFDAKDRYVLWNQKYAALYSEIAEHLRPGITFEEILRASLASGQNQEIVPDQEAWLRARMEKFKRPSSQEEHRLKDGRWLRYDDSRMPDGGAIGMRIDITELKQREEWLAQLFDANPMPMILCDAESLQILEANLAASHFYGFGQRELLARRACDMHAGDEVARFANRLLHLSGDREAGTVWRQYTADGRERHVLIYVRLLHEGMARRLLLTIADVTERMMAETEANRLAHHDVLTGLPNRMQFYKVLEEALHSGGTPTVYYLDLDGFKPVNDTFGHAAGDEVLKMVGARLQKEAADHLVARLGGDEFAILCGSGHADVADLAERCIDSLQAPFNINGLPISIGVSIGIAAAVGGSDGETLMQAADRALYVAKEEGRNTWRVSDEGHSAAPRLKVN
jgi:diguanylate cyclase (GGDEF)-like protein/PAS domain S-box-containing protein